jgi:hypothetical protein
MSEFKFFRNKCNCKSLTFSSQNQTLSKFCDSKTSFLRKDNSRVLFVLKLISLSLDHFRSKWSNTNQILKLFYQFSFFKIMTSFDKLNQNMKTRQIIATMFFSLMFALLNLLYNISKDIDILEL